MSARKDITIRFCLAQCDGEPVEKSKFSKEELADIRNCLSLVLDYSPREPSPKIISVQIIHDGITPVEGDIEGYFINRKCPREEPLLDGYPTPIARFLLDHSIDEKDFLDYINESSYCVRTIAMDQNEEESYFAEDHNGYSSVLSRKQRDQAIIFLQNNEAYCGKIFHFPDGLPEGGHPIPAMKFALKPASKRKS